MSFIAALMLLLCLYSIFYILTVKTLSEFKNDAEIIDERKFDIIYFKNAYFLNISTFCSSLVAVLNFAVKLEIEFTICLQYKSNFFYYF